MCPSTINILFNMYSSPLKVIDNVGLVSKLREIYGKSLLLVVILHLTLSCLSFVTSNLHLALQ